MSMRILALVAPALLGSVPTADAAVHSAVIFTRTGERTPILQTSGPARLTALGAQQAHDQGNFFRQAYVSGETNEGDATGPRPIVDLSKDALRNDQMFVLAPENDYATATALAFLQGLYPPLGVDESSAALLDGAATLYNGSFVQAPLGGYQYPQLRTASSYDPNLIYVAGAYGCVNAARDRIDYLTTEESSETKNRTGELYENVGNAALVGALNEDMWNYERAYLIYDYVNYAYWHDPSVHQAFANNETLRGTLDQLRYLADQQQWAMVNSTDPMHFVRSIAGQALASKILNQLYINIDSAGSAAKLSLLFGEFDPILAFIGLTGLSEQEPDLRGIPAWASSLVIELYSDEPAGQSSNTSAATSSSPDGSTQVYPDVANLFVRFYLRNGSDPSTPMNQYGIFQTPQPASNADRHIPFQEFESALTALSLGSVSFSGSFSSSQQDQGGHGDDEINAPFPMLPDPAVPAWCAVCEARSIFCTALNADLKGPKGGGQGRKKAKDDYDDDSALSPAAAGVLGAGLVFVVAIIAALILGTCGRVRLSRGPRPASNPKLPYLPGFGSNTTGPNAPSGGNDFAAKAASASAATAAALLPCLPSSKRRRLHRRNASSGSNGGGGFKGSDKLGSDLDVSFACHGAAPGSHASIAGFVPPPPLNPPPKAAARMSSIVGPNQDLAASDTPPIGDAYARSASSKADTFAGLGGGAGIGIGGEPVAHARTGSWELKEKGRKADDDAGRWSSSSAAAAADHAEDTRSNFSGSTNVSRGTPPGPAMAPRSSSSNTMAPKFGEVGNVATVHHSPFAIGDGEDFDVVDSRRSSGDVFEEAVAVEIVHRV